MARGINSFWKKNTNAATKNARSMKNAKVWRINEFFKEPEYYLGRNVDAIFNGGKT